MHQTLYFMCYYTPFLVMEGLRIADLLQSGWQLHAWLQDSVAPWHREREVAAHRETERGRERMDEKVSEDQISFCLHQWSVIWPTMALHLSYLLLLPPPQ